VEKTFRIKEPPVPVISEPSTDAWFFHWFSGVLKNFKMTVIICQDHLFENLENQRASEHIPGLITSGYLSLTLRTA
jgi:hypothetical protein